MYAETRPVSRRDLNPRARHDPDETEANMARAPANDRKVKKGVRGQGALKIYHSLRHDILTMSLPPGDPLDEVMIAKRFDVSRSPVREALIRLSSEGLVKTLPNKSTMVAPLNVEEFPKYLDALDLMQRVTARLAATQHTADDLVRIKAAQTVFQRALEQRDALAMIEANRDFHIAISDAGHNRYFTLLYTRLLDEGRRMLRLYFRSLDDKLPPEFSGEHQKIIDAIENRDAKLAEKLAHGHAIQVSDRFLAYLGTRCTENIRL
jgi:DNA-binding GntR family transcriptional regulator